MLHKGTTDGPRHQPFIDHSAVFSLLTSVARSVEFDIQTRYQTRNQYGRAIKIARPLHIRNFRGAADVESEQGGRYGARAGKGGKTAPVQGTESKM